MDTIKKKIIIILSLTLILLLLSTRIYINVKKQKCLNEVTNYLYQEKGYTEADIKMIESKKSRLPSYYVKVIFENEPTIMYSYFCKRKIGQFENYPIYGPEIPIDQLKNYDPY